VRAVVVGEAQGVGARGADRPRDRGERMGKTSL
jgi:hypothetical protein